MALVKARNSKLQNFQTEVLDIVDVVVSKLKRFHANDRSDIEAMVDMGLVPHEELIARFRAAIDFNDMAAYADNYPAFTKNLHRVERDSYGVAETEIELPLWM